MKFRILYAIAAVALLSGCKDRNPDQPPMYGNAPAQTAPAPAVSMQAPAPQPVVEEYVFDGQRVFFDFDQYAITDDARQNLAAQAAYLQANPNIRILIEGHTDERGSHAYNMALGRRRADAARDVLVADGVDASRIQTKSFGKTQPLVPESNEEAWRQNRNATTVVVK